MSTNKKPSVYAGLFLWPSAVSPTGSEFGEISHCTFISTGGQFGICLQRRSHLAWTIFGRFPAQLILLQATRLKFGIGDQDINTAIGNINANGITLTYQTNISAGTGLR